MTGNAAEKKRLRVEVDLIALNQMSARLRAADHLVSAVEHVVNDSPGTPHSVKQYLRSALSWWEVANAEEPS